jgi:hypothetical protein
LNELLVSDVTRGNLLQYIGWLRAKIRDGSKVTSNDDLHSRAPSITSPRFDFLLAAELAGFAFEV